MKNMKNTTTLLRALVPALVLSAALPAGAQPQSDCSCNDAADLYARYCSAQAATREWDRLISRLRSEEQKRGEPITAGEAKDAVATCTDEIIFIHRNENFRDTRKAGGATDNTCKVTVNAPTACLAGVIAHHESWHKMMCEAHNRADAPWRATSNPFSYLVNMIDRLPQMSIIDYMNEERTGYMLETNYARNKLEELAHRCPLQSIFEPAGGRRSFTLKACPVPDMSGYQPNRQCAYK